MNIFWGNEICCGAYAFLNTVQDREIDCKIFEITSSVPFGIRHRKESDYSRLLTTYCDPNIGIDRAAALWGYRQKKEMFCDGGKAAEYILEKSKMSRCLAGPLDMGRLGYLALPNLYANMDHYITIFQEDGVLFCMDSEGIPVRHTDKEELKSWLRADRLPEAEGRISVRSYEKASTYSGITRKESALKESLKLIIKNLTEAQETAQGSYAIEKCWQWLQGKPVKRWQLSFLYDIGYLSQRKILQQYWCRLVDEVHLLERDMVRETERIVEEQIHTLGSMFNVLRRENRILEQDFRKLAEMEKELSTLFGAYMDEK